MQRLFIPPENSMSSFGTRLLVNPGVIPDLWVKYFEAPDFKMELHRIAALPITADWISTTYDMCWHKMFPDQYAQQVYSSLTVMVRGDHVFADPHSIRLALDTVVEAIRSDYGRVRDYLAPVLTVAAVLRHVNTGTLNMITGIEDFYIPRFMFAWVAGLASSIQHDRLCVPAHAPWVERLVTDQVAHLHHWQCRMAMSSTVWQYQIPLMSRGRWSTYSGAIGALLTYFQHGLKSPEMAHLEYRLGEHQRLNNHQEVAILMEQINRIRGARQESLNMGAVLLSMANPVSEWAWPRIGLIDPTPRV